MFHVEHYDELPAVPLGTLLQFALYVPRGTLRHPHHHARNVIMLGCVADKGIGFADHAALQLVRRG